MFCNACGDQLPESSKFCGSCGASFSAHSVPTRRTTTQVHETKSSGTGVVLSFFWTGLGQLYAKCPWVGHDGGNTIVWLWDRNSVRRFCCFFWGIRPYCQGKLRRKALHGQVSASWGFLRALPLSLVDLGMVDANQNSEAFNRGDLC